MRKKTYKLEGRIDSPTFILGEAYIAYKTRNPVATSVRLTNPDDAYELFKKLFNAETISLNETMYMLCLNRNKNVICAIKLSEGSRNGTVFPMEKVLMAAIISNADTVIVAHNHPGGSLIPSDQDISMTKRLSEALMTVDIKLIDSMIVTSESYRSII